ncbi:MFS transporter [Chloroflexota bacterium]
MTEQEVGNRVKAKPRFFYGYIIVIAAVIMRMAMISPRSSYGVFFKPMLNEFAWSRALISGAYSISSITQALSGIIMGGLNDKLGPRLVMTICGFVIGLGLLLMSQIGAAWHLYLLYVLVIGIGMGASFTPPMSTVVRWFVKRRSIMTGIVSAGGGLAGLMLPPAVNWLISNYGWRNAYIALGAIVLVIVIVTAQFLKRDPAQMGQVPYGDSKTEEPESNLFAEGLSLKEAIRSRQYWIAVSIFFCAGFSLSTITVHIVPHATDLGFSTGTAASILATVSGSFLVGGIMLGAIADRIGNRRGYIISFIIMAAALFWLLTVKEVQTLYLLAVVFGFGGGGANTLESPLVAELFGIRSHGLILGSCSVFFLSGAAAGPFIAGYAYDVNGSYNWAFSACAVASILGIILVTILRPVKRPATVKY